MAEKMIPPCIWGIGRNYKDHAIEMNANIPEAPLVFLKSGGCALQSARQFQIPNFVENLHHELEIAVCLDGNHKPERVALALDLTARDIQAKVKAKGHPWSLAKSFKESCPLSSWIPFEHYDWFSKLEFQLEVNREIKQRGQTRDMIFPLESLIAYLGAHYPLQKGDIILTGTPAGVGPLKAGDEIKGTLQGLISWDLKIETSLAG